MALEQQIKEILEREMPDAQVQVERDPDSEKIGGRIIWQGFAGHTRLRRQRQIFGALRRQLRAADEREISFIFTYTPNEFEVTQAV
jgi:acid stress-induced BolA-like protein IbaG/YrbA